MVFYAHYLQESLESPTIVVITDRNDLDDQLYGQFARCKDFLRQTPQHAESRKNLKELLANRQANGIIFTTMQKFEESNEALSERRNIIVMADEAHRGQYGLNEKVVVRALTRTTEDLKSVFGEDLELADWLGGIREQGDYEWCGFNASGYDPLMIEKRLEQQVKRQMAEMEEHYETDDRI